MAADIFGSAGDGEHVLMAFAAIKCLCGREERMRRVAEHEKAQNAAFQQGLAERTAAAEKRRRELESSELGKAVLAAEVVEAEAKRARVEAEDAYWASLIE